MRREKSNYMIQSVAHALDVIEQFGGGQEELGVTELSKRLKLHKNNVFRLLATLESRGYIEQNKLTENYRLGICCLQLGQRYIAHMGLLQQARPILAELAAKCKETAFVAVLRNRAMVAVAAVEPNQPVRIVSKVGDVLPLHCTAAGKIHLACASSDELQASLPSTLRRHTDQTITDQQQLNAQLKQASKQGYAVECGEFVPDVHSVATPVRDYTHSIVASLAVAGPAYRLSTERIERAIGPAVVEAGRELSRRLGFHP